MIEKKETSLNESLKYKKLSNNLDVFIMRKPSVNKKYAILAADYGSNDLVYINPHTGEKVSLNYGIAHFLEHKMFEMPDGKDAFEEFSKYGANANAFTSFDMTGYLFSVSDSENFKKSLKHLINYVQTPYFTDENVNKEKGIIAQEIRMYDDNPGWQLFFTALHNMYKTHPNSIDIAGDVESIHKITKEELNDCYSTFYSPSNMALFATGDFDEDEILSVIEENISDKNRFDGEIKRLNPGETDPPRETKTSKKMQVSVPMVSISYKEKNASLVYGQAALKKEIAVDIAGGIMFSAASELYNSLFEQGLIFANLSYSYSRSRDYGYSIISAVTSDPDKVCQIITEKIATFIKNGITDEEFERSKKCILGSYIRKYDDIASFANDYLSSFFNKIDLFDYNKAYNSIDKSYVHQMICDIFDPDMKTVNIINPIKE